MKENTKASKGKLPKSNADNPTTSAKINQASAEFLDNRPAAVAQRKLQATLNQSQQLTNLRGIQQIADQSKQVAQKVDDDTFEEDFRQKEQGVKLSQPRATKKGKQKKKERRAIATNLAVRKSKDYFAGTADTPVTEVTMLEVINLLKNAARRGKDTLKRNAQYLLNQKDLTLLAGIHRGGLGGGGMAVDKKEHITVEVKGQTYHLRMNTNNRKAPTYLFSITPNAPNVSSDFSYPAAAEATKAKEDPLEAYVERKYKAKLLEYKKRYGRPLRGTYLLVLYNYKGTDKTISNRLKRDSQLREEMNEAAILANLKEKPKRRR
ncbi:MAG: hypothetical protein AB8G15_02760 [Saprospiraceae bacterium]